MNKNMNIRLKTKRMEKGLSQKELASLIGVTNQSISEYERGKVNPSYENMKKISQALNATVQELFF